MAKCEATMLNNCRIITTAYSFPTCSEKGSATDTMMINSVELCCTAVADPALSVEIYTAGSHDS